MDLFSQTSSNSSMAAQAAPLAHLLRPHHLDDFIGHEKILGPQAPLRRWIEADQVPSIVLWGPPGCGKTTLAHIIAEKTTHHFAMLSAVQSGIKDIKEVVEQAKLRQSLGRKTLLFIDEIHRFNKAQQDALLPHVEDGTITLIGATTENVSFEINTALLSRCKVIRVDPLNQEAIEKILKRAMKLLEQRQEKLQIEKSALSWISATSEGDARRALGILDILRQERRTEEWNLDQIKKLLSRTHGQLLYHDKKGDRHYDTISAFIKSLRGSDVNAAIYYLARMLEAGEDPRFIARRLMIFAAEDIGNADPQATLIANAARQAVLYIGLPEARINLAQAVTYLALAPKSNASYVAIEKALHEVRTTGSLPIPLHLLNPVHSILKNEGYGQGYQYAHDQEEQLVTHSHLPDGVQVKDFYQPKNVGFEKTLQQRKDYLEQKILGKRQSNNR